MTAIHLQYAPEGQYYAFQKPDPVPPSYQAPIIAGSPAPIAPRPAPVLPSAAALGGVDVRTAPDRLRAYCDALDRRVERLERGLLDAGYRLSLAEHRIAYLEDAEVGE